uniref:MATH domain-containing protein n=1 Tax=Panagrolaimus sp. JU765 TaxID=591449 RepID=A0AC34Q2M5_9BILA
MDYHGKYLSIFLNLMKHDFDDVLSWPFNHEITLTLMDSDPEKNLRHVIKPKEMHANFASFAQPNFEMNPKFGIEKFCDLKILENFIKNDAIFIKCEIDTETMIIL